MGNPSEIQLTLLLPGVTLLAVSGFLYASTRRFLAVARTAPGTILESRNNNPRFTFTAEDGTELVVQSHTGTKAPSFRKGQTVLVLYDPAKPTKAKINTFFQLWFAPAICAALGLSFSLAGCFVK